MKFREGNDVLLYLNPRKTYLIKIEKEKTFHTHKGFINLKEIIGKDYGYTILSSLGIKFLALKPMLRDYIMKSKRRTQITYPKDIALIVIFSGIGSGDHVVEAGTGTGALTLALAHYIKPNGKVYSYEIREEFLKNAEKNLQRANLTEYVEFKNKDITIGIDEKEIDAVILDLATPWLVIQHAYKALKNSGIIVSFSPTIDQVIKTVEELKENSFVDINSIECLMRRMQIERGKTRPQTLMTGHTGYITFARKSIRI